MLRFVYTINNKTIIVGVCGELRAVLSIGNVLTMVLHVTNMCCGIKLRTICFVIAYLHLVSCVLDIAFHLLTVAIVTDGFQCDVNYDKFSAIPWAVVEPLLLVLNLGTHGFYPFPGTFRRQYNMYVEYTSIIAEPRCYPGILHVYLVDILNFLINLIWLRIVVSYLGALYKRNPEPMRMFLSLSIVKVVMQIIYFGYQPHFFDIFGNETYWFLKLLDIFIAVVFITIIQKYTKALRLERATGISEKPPSYVECLINASLQGFQRSPPKKEQVIDIDEKKTVEKQNVESPA